MISVKYSFYVVKHLLVTDMNNDLQKKNHYLGFSKYV